MGNDANSNLYNIGLMYKHIRLFYKNVASIDFEDSIQKQGFTIDNPNAAGTCACGDSFS